MGWRDTIADSSTAPAVGGDGGWRSTITGKGAPPEPEVLQEMHPDFTTADRLVVKNFAANDEDAVNYLQKKHPNLEIKLAPGGEIRARKKNSDEPYKVLDPQQGILDSFTNPVEALRDVGDAGYDLLSGIGTTAGAATGGLTGAAATMGPGAIPGAMAGGAITNAGLEDIRQRIGQALGVNEGDVDTGRLKTAAIGGAVAPLLLGSGATAGQIAETAATSGMTKEALGEAQKGLLSRAWSSLPAAASKLTGVPKDAIEGAMENWPAMLGLSKAKAPVTDLTDQAAADIGSSLRNAKKGAWQQYADALSSTDGRVSTDAARDTFKSAIAKAQSTADETKTAASQELVDALKDAFNKHFTTSEQGELKDLSPTAAAAVERQLSELADLSSTGSSGIGNRFGAGAGAAEKAVAQTAAAAKRDLSGSLEDVLPEEALAARKRYGDVAKLEESMQPLFKDTDKAYATLRNLSRNANRGKLELLDSIDKEFGTDTIGKAKLASAYTHLADPSLLPLSAEGASGLARANMLRGAGALAGGGIGEYYGGHKGGAIGAGSGAILASLLGNPAALRAYIGLAMKAKPMTDFVSSIPDAALTAPAVSGWNALKGQ